MYCECVGDGRRGGGTGVHKAVTVGVSARHWGGVGKGWQGVADLGYRRATW